MSDPRPDPFARFAVPVLLALLILSFVGLDRGLWTPDEPREAEIGREMLLSPGVVPTLNGERFMEKPPLYYWLVASAYRMAGAPSPAAARTVSVVAGCITLLVVFLWGRRAHSASLGLVAAVMLATSLQFLLTGHWIMVDTLLMLFTTIAAWTAFELVNGAGRVKTALLFYAAMALALWTKGLIGPVLIGAGLCSYFLVTRRFPWRSLYLAIGIPAAFLAIGALALGIFQTGGGAALWEWAWVNHVLRFVKPDRTGHEQPLPYYLWTVPFAVLPWIVPLADALRPARWRDATAGGDLRRYCVAMAGGMLVVLTASATKRGIYLMPVLPVLFLGFAVNVVEWQADSRRSLSLGRWWAVQAVLVGACALALPIAAVVYRREADAVAIGFTLLGIGACAALLSAWKRADPGRALITTGAAALLAATGYLALAPRVLDRDKDLAPFMAAVDRQLPPGEAVHAVGADETLLAIVPFVTGRSVISAGAGQPGVPASWLADPPRWLLVQTKVKKQSPPDLGVNYELVDGRNFGPGRNISLWRQTGGAANPGP